jgi:streptogramin lyase
VRLLQTVEAGAPGSGPSCNSTRTTHFTHWNPRLPGATSRAGAPCSWESGSPPTLVASSSLVRFDPARERFQSFPLRRPGANVRQLLGRRGEVWGAESGTDRIVVARWRPGQSAVTSP